MKISLIIFFLFISISNGLLSQTFKKPIDYRFKGREDGYVSFFANNISIPDQSLKKGIFGNLIIRISINPGGGISGLTLINPIDSLVDNEVIRVINLSRNFWKKNDTLSLDQVFYIQIGFSRPAYLPHLFKPKSEALIKLFPKPILIPLESDFKIPFIKSEDLAEKVNLSLDNGKFEDALLTINELIKRDPFNRDLYKTRIMVNIKLGKPELAEEDDNKIFNFAEGFSLDDLYKNQDN